MKILHILPELEEGGVERHVLMLSEKQHESGHEVYVVSAGGKMVSLFADGIRQIHLPVHKKNPVTGIYCAIRLAPIIKQNGIDIIHAHSRVPAWIAMFASRFSGRPFIVTAHAYFSTQVRLIYLPYRRAERVICVSRAVKESMKNCFADNTVVIPNGLPPATTAWQGSDKTEMRFLFVGRLTRLKGLQDIIKVLPEVKGNWRLDILGDGPLRAELEAAVMSKGLKDQVLFHGFHNDPDTWMEKSDCLLFPSYIEGMPLTLARAIQIGLPVLATDIEPVCEMALKKEGLIHAGDLNA
ncbi:MAG: glycosyltransferase family 4 protein, partial [Desulfobulbales bacterium]